MRLRDSLDLSPSLPDPLDPYAAWKYACGIMAGYSFATGIELAISTGGSTMQLHNLTAGTRSAVIVRSRLATAADVTTALRAQLDALPYWAPEGEDWGPDPWADLPMDAPIPDAGREKAR